MASVGVHHEESALGLLGIEVAAKDDLTVPGRATARALVRSFVSVSATGEHRESHGYHREGHDGEDRPEHGQGLAHETSPLVLLNGRPAVTGIVAPESNCCPAIACVIAPPELHNKTGMSRHGLEP